MSKFFTLALMLLGMSILSSTCSLTAEEGQEKPKEAAEGGEAKSKMANAHGAVSAVDSTAKTITIVLASEEEGAAPQSLTVSTNAETSIKAGKDDKTLADIPANTQIMIRYNPETKVAQSIRLKTEKGERTEKSDKAEKGEKADKGEKKKKPDTEEAREE